MRGLSEVYGIDETRTSAYRPSTNWVSERLHMTLNSMLEKIVSELQRDWDSRVQGVMAAYRATVHEATEYSPNILMFGRDSERQSTWNWEDQRMQVLQPGRVCEAFRRGKRTLLHAIT